MTDQQCLYVMLHAPRERLEDLLMQHLAPVVDEIRTAPELDSLFFVRFSEPSWQLRFRVLGRPAWIKGAIGPRMRDFAERLQRSHSIESSEFATYDREYERYGGEEGMELAEKLFFLDSLAVLDWIAAERRGKVAKSRREFSILLVDRLLDLARFDHCQRLAFYRHGYAWATETKGWGADEVAALEKRFQRLRPGLEGLFFGDPALDPAALWGGDEAARIAQAFLSHARPVAESILEGHAAGRIRQDLVYLFWSYAHMFSNRLGIESAGEAVLRFFLHRLMEEHGKARV
jgi:thiopeptide-type bacteriocin biosynthesis protein